MNKLQRFSMAIVLTLMLAASALAGDIWLGKAPPPPPPGEIGMPAPSPQSPSSPSPSTRGDIWTGATQVSDFASDSVEILTVSLLQSILSVF